MTSDSLRKAATVLRKVLIEWFLVQVYRALAEYGTVFLPGTLIGPHAESGDEEPADMPVRHEPPLGHPERLVPDLLLTDVERALQQQLDLPGMPGMPSPHDWQ